MSRLGLSVVCSFSILSGCGGALPVALYLVTAGAVLGIARARGLRWRDLAADALGEARRRTARAASA